MIKYFLNSGDEDNSLMFTPYIWKQSGFGDLIEHKFFDKNYGSDLELILIKYYVQGKFSSYLPSEPKIGNYSKVNRDISVDIGVPIHLFHERNEFERREFIVDSTILAVELVRNRLLKRKLDIDFGSLLQDLKEVSVDYLKKEGPYSPF